MKYLVEFRNGGYLGPNTEATGRSVSRGNAQTFDTLKAAERAAGEWGLAGGMVVPNTVTLSMDLALRLRETLGPLTHGFDGERRAELQALYREIDEVIHEARRT
jgi:hypothetical protein